MARHLESLGLEVHTGILKGGLDGATICLRADMDALPVKEATGLPFASEQKGARMAKKGVAGLVTDGVMRSAAGVLGTSLPIWCDGIAAPASVAGLTFVGWQEPIACSGVAVFPDDIIVADDDGAVLIPAALLDDVLAEAPEQEAQEAWIMIEIDRGVPLPGLYPMNDETKVRYAAFKEGK